MRRTTLNVRSLVEEDWRDHRDLRLEMLARLPDRVRRDSRPRFTPDRARVASGARRGAGAQPGLVRRHRRRVDEVGGAMAATSRRALCRCSSASTSAPISGGRRRSGRRPARSRRGVGARLRLRARARRARRQPAGHPLLREARLPRHRPAPHLRPASGRPRVADGEAALAAASRPRRGRRPPGARVQFARVGGGGTRSKCTRAGSVARAAWRRRAAGGAGRQTLGRAGGRDDHGRATAWHPARRRRIQAEQLHAGSRRGAPGSTPSTRRSRRRSGLRGACARARRAAWVRREVPASPGARRAGAADRPCRGARAFR